MEGDRGKKKSSDPFKSSSGVISSSSGIFSPIFPPPGEKKKGVGNSSESGNTKSGPGHKRSSTKEMLELYPEEKTKPFHYGSSIYYGAQDVYFQPETTQKPGAGAGLTGATPGQQDGGGGGGEALDGALRGNWWQGSLYY